METPSATPLRNLRIVWTGSHSGGRGLLEAVEKAGAKIARFPLIEFAPPSDPDKVNRVLDQLDRFAWILFTSQQAIRQVLHLAPPAARVAAVGPLSTNLLQSHGWSVHLSADGHSARNLAKCLSREPVPDKPALFVRGDKALPALPALLLKRGWTVEELEVYRSMPIARDSALRVAQRIASNADVVIMGSPSGVRTLAEALPDGGISSIQPHVRWLALGNTTFESLKAAGVPHPLRLDSVTPECLVSTLMFTFQH